MADRDPCSLDAEFAPAHAAAVYAVEIDGEAVLLDQVVNRLHLLNRSATLLWICFDGRTTVRELVAEISDELGLPYDTVLADTLRVVQELGAQGLLHGVRADTPAPADLA
jgi:hypothetical protein